MRLQPLGGGALKNQSYLCAPSLAIKVEYDITLRSFVKLDNVDD